MWLFFFKTTVYSKKLKWMWFFLLNIILFALVYFLIYFDQQKRTHLKKSIKHFKVI